MSSSNNPNDDSFYPPPPWAKKTHHEWSLLEIKNGVSVQEHPLSSRACTVLGRALDMVHIGLAHESCSRQHARLAFDSSGTLWLRDLASTHGTAVNKKKVPAQACGKTESTSRQAGARGVILYPGDVIQFGASTRLFCVQGPEEFERGKVQARAAAAKASLPPPEPVAETGEEKEEESRPLWGIDMDDHREDGEDQSSEKFEFKEEEIPDKYRRDFEQIKALHYKLSNIQSESDRILRKGGLNAGQEKQLQRNSDREKELTQKIEEKERELHAKLHPESQKQQSSVKKYDAVQGDEDVVDIILDDVESVFENFLPCRINKPGVQNFFDS